MSYFRPLVVWLFAAASACVGVQAQVPAAPPSIPTPPTPLASPALPAPTLSQTVGGLTVKITHVRWSVAKSAKSSFYPTALFTVRYTVLADPAARYPPGTNLLDCVQSVTAEDPSGFPYEDLSDFHFPYGAYGGHNHGSVTWDNVDPRDAAVKLNFELRSPAATPREAGDSENPITISNIPVPLSHDVGTPVHAETITPLGTHVIVENVKVTTKPDENGDYTFLKVHIVPAADAPDLGFEHSTGTRITDDTGVNISRDGTGTGGSVGNAVELLAVAGVPSPSAKKLTLTLDARESSESLRQQQFFPQFHLLIPLQSVVPVRHRVSPPLATFQAENVDATLDSLGIENGCYQARMILRDRHDPAVIWRVYEVHGKTDAGTALQNTNGSSSFFWKVNDTPLAAGENGWELLINETGEAGHSRDAPPPAHTLSLTVDLRAYGPAGVFLDFDSVPIPAPGQTLALKRRVQDASGAYLVLRNIAAYSPAHPLPPGFEYPSYGQVSPLTPSGLAVVVAEPPAPTGKNEFDFNLITADTPAGDTLLTKRTLDQAPGDALLGSSQDPSDRARVKTFFLTMPLPGVHTVTLRLYHAHTTRLDEHETVTFPDVPAPLLPKPPAPGRP